MRFPPFSEALDTDQENTNPQVNDTNQGDRGSARLKHPWEAPTTKDPLIDYKQRLLSRRCLYCHESLQAEPGEIIRRTRKMLKESRMLRSELHCAA